jgi:hypothetical protein
MIRSGGGGVTASLDDLLEGRDIKYLERAYMDGHDVLIVTFHPNTKALASRDILKA